MRSYPIHIVILLCLLLLAVDTATFFYLHEILKMLKSAYLVISITALFWVFSISLVMAILILKIRLDAVNPKRRQRLISNLYGLTISSFIPKSIFIIVISILYFTNYSFNNSESMIIIPLFGVFSGFLPFFVIVYAIFKAKYNFKIYHIDIVSKLLPKSFENFKIVQISDLHLGSFNYKYQILERAFELINKESPDIICFTGDLVNNYAWELEGWESTFKKLNPEIKKYAVLGNHDYGDYSEWPSEIEKQNNANTIRNFLKNVDFNLLLNEHDVVSIDNENFAVLGVENWGNPPFKQYGDLKEAIKGVKHIPFKILLSHDPSHWSQEVINNTDIALTLSGHTHGMQAGINLKNKQWSPIKYKYKHWAGLYKHKDQFLYVNRGLGWMGFPGRLGMRPEISCFTLRNDKG